MLVLVRFVRVLAIFCLENNTDMYLNRNNVSPLLIHITSSLVVRNVHNLLLKSKSGICNIKLMICLDHDYIFRYIFVYVYLRYILLVLSLNVAHSQNKACKNCTK